MDRDKFRELIVYIAEKTADDRSFGDTKLNKTLYWIDSFGYSHLGEPVTGARYQRGEHGPIARALVPVRRDLAKEGAVDIEKRAVGTRYATATVARRPADTRLFAEDELELIDDIIGQVKGRTATAVREASHEQSVGWNVVERGDDIPYSMSLISRDPPSGETLVAARKVAERLGR